MPRVVPSQIIGFIDQVFPQAKKENIKFYLDRNHAASCAVIIDLIEQLPSELLALSQSCLVMLNPNIFHLQTGER